MPQSFLPSFCQAVDAVIRAWEDGVDRQVVHLLLPQARGRVPFVVGISGPWCSVTVPRSLPGAGLCSAAKNGCKRSGRQPTRILTPSPLLLGPPFAVEHGRGPRMAWRHQAAVQVGPPTH